MNTLLHMITIKLSPSNYLLWKNQMLSLLAYQNLLPHNDGSAVAPSPEVLTDGKSSPNTLYTTWKIDDQRAVIILHASLSEEAVAEIVGLPSARLIWLALETAYNNSSVERIQNLRDQLRQSVKVVSTVVEFARKFEINWRP